MGSGEKKRISFIIPTINQTTMLEKCIDSIQKVCMDGYRDLYDYEILVVDDGSSEEIQAYLKQLSKNLNVKLLLNKENQGFTKAVNMGLRKASGEMLILVNNDILFVQKNWLGHMLNALKRYEKVGIVGCRLLYPNGKIQHGGIVYDGHMHHRYLNQAGDFKPATKVEKTVAVTGAVMLITREAFEDIGTLDEKYIIAYSDIDYCLRAYEKGWTVVYNGRSYAIHHEGATRHKSGDKRLPIWAAMDREDCIRFYEQWRNTMERLHREGKI